MTIMNRVLVGVDESPASRSALQWAAVHAEMTGAELWALHVLDWPLGLTASAVKSGTRLHVPKQDIAEPYRRGLHQMFLDVKSPPGSTLRFAQGDIADVLVRLSAEARLLVIGLREPVRGRPCLSARVTHDRIINASCPVVTVPERLARPWSAPAHPGRHPHASPAAVSR